MINHTSQSGGFFTALDADSSRAPWKFRVPTPQVARRHDNGARLGVWGDVCAFNVRIGGVLWRHHSGEAMGGTVCYKANGRQGIAVAEGLNSPLWATKLTRASVTMMKCEINRIRRSRSRRT